MFFRHSLAIGLVFVRVTVYHNRFCKSIDFCAKKIGKQELLMKKKKQTSQNVSGGLAGSKNLCKIDMESCYLGEPLVAAGLF